MSYLSSLYRAIRAALLMYEIWETEHYLRDCERDGLVHSLHLDEWRGRLCDMRVRLALLSGSKA